MQRIRIGLFVLIIACSTDSGNSNVVVRDSAGVRMVENWSRSWSAQETWRIEPEARIVIRPNR